MTKTEYMERLERARLESRERRKDEPRQELERLLRLSRVPKAYWDVTLEKVPEREYKRKLKSWHEKFYLAFRENRIFPGLFLHGPTGSGKTALAAGVLKWGNVNRIHGLWLDYDEIPDSHRYNPLDVEGTPEGRWSYAQRAPLLVIDDLGRGGLKNSFSELQMRLAEQLVRTRWANGHATIITSNVGLRSLAESGFEAFAGVLSESCYDLEIKGANYRSFLDNSKEPL